MPPGNSAGATSAVISIAAVTYFVRRRFFGVLNKTPSEKWAGFASRLQSCVMLEIVYAIGVRQYGEFAIANLIGAGC